MNFQKAVLIALHTGNETELRKIPEGRAFLLEIAKERRKIPLEIRRFPRVAGEEMAKNIDNLILSVLNSHEDNKELNKQKAGGRE